MGKFEGKVVFVTGSAMGIGKAIATKFAREGAHVVCTDIGRDSLDSLVSKFASLAEALMHMLWTLPEESGSRRCQ